MDVALPLPSILNVESGRITVLLFSQPGCEFCAEIREHYLRPMLSSRAGRMRVAEAGIESTDPIRGWNGRVTTQRDFARALDVRFAPTVMFFSFQGRPIAAPIVGLSKDYFGAYLEQRLRVAMQAAAPNLTE
ncbi:MAG: thioredoxin fold domain-containing protein [Caldimonas sp.]